MNEDSIQLLNKKKELINSVSPSFCTAKWLQTTLYLQTGYNHSCHHPTPHHIPLIELQDPAALSNSDYKKTQREMMLNGFRPSECSYCWKIEDMNNDYFSDRHYKTSDDWAWDRFEEVVQSNPYDNINPSYLEVSFSNACNLKCVYCSPEISSSWADELEKFGSHPALPSLEKHVYKNSDTNPYLEAFWKWFPSTYSSLKVFRITGGEPLMTKNTWKILEYIYSHPHSNLELSINTNLCVQLKLVHKLTNKLRNIRHAVKCVNIYTSLESIGSQAEYARSGLVFNEWLSNIKYILDNTNFSVSIMTTINVLSLPSFIEFIELVMDLRRQYNDDFSYNRIPLSINILHYPEHLSVLILPLELRKQYAEKILAVCESWLKYNSKEKYARLYLEEWDQIKRFCNYLVSSEQTNKQQEFKNFIEEIDRRRNTSFIQTFPEYADVWQTITTNITS